jgi:hypothetical protein
MKLLSHGLAIGLGYMLGRPEGRERLAQVGRQAADLSRRPEVAQLRERGRSLAADQAQAVKQKISSRTTAGAAADTTAADTTAGTAAAPSRRRLRAPEWRPRFSRSRTAHFPPTQDIAPPAALGGTTVMEDSEAAVLGTPVTPRPDSAAPTGDR